MATVSPEDFKPNSFKSKEEVKAPAPKEREKLKPVVTKGSVVSTKKPLYQKFAETFIAEDAENVKAWVLTDVLIPGIKHTLLDMLYMFFFGGTNYSRGSNSSYYNYANKSNVSYGHYRYGGVNNDPRQVRDTAPHNGKVDYRHIIVGDINSANAIVDELWHRIDSYGQTSIAELLDLIDETGKYTDNNWGWDDKREIGVRRVNGGYLIDVAEAKPID